MRVQREREGERDFDCMPTSDEPSGGWGWWWSSWAVVSRRELMVSFAALLIVLLTLLLGRVNSTVVLITSRNDSIPFPDIEATFGMSLMPSFSFILSSTLGDPFYTFTPLISSD